jgi:pyruvate/2-oxoglutarate/acetoin dehydrogenase E1 component
MAVERSHADAVVRLVARGAVFLVEGDGGLADAAPAASVRRVPVSDRATAGVAVGMALAGRPVVVEVADSGRLAAITEVLSEAGRFGARGALPALWWVPVGGDVGLDRPCLDALVGIDGLQVWCASDTADVAALADDALASGRPTVLLVSRRLEEAGGEVVAGVGRRYGSGGRLTLVAVGEAVAAARAVADGVEGIEVVALTHLEGRGALGARVRASGRLVVAVPPGEESFGRRLVQECLGEAFLYLESPPAVCAGEAAVVRGAVMASLDY